MYVISKVACRNKRFRFMKRCLNCSWALSQEVSEKIKQDYNKDDTSQHTIKTGNLPKRSLQPQKDPFLKNVFAGVVDRDLLSFPRVLDSDHVNVLEENVQIIKNIFADQVDSNLIDRTGKIPDKLINTLKNLRIFGQKVPPDYGGLGFVSTEYARIMEVLSQDISIAIMQYTHEVLCAKAILEYGNDQQKEKYLRKLATGEWLATYCLAEPDVGSEDIFSIKTTAFRADDGYWYLNGKKSWVCNGKNSDVFVVLARTVVTAKEKYAADTVEHLPYFYYNEDDFYDTSVVNDPDRENKQYVCNNVTAFLVEKSFNGISYHTEGETTGLHGANLCNITFYGTRVPDDNILGKLNEGHVIPIDNPANDRCIIGCMAASTVKKLLKDITEYSLDKKPRTTPLSSYDSVRMKLANMNIKLYVMESIIHFTCGLLDIYENPDCSIESAIVKIVCSELAWDCINECLQIYGINSFSKNHPLERHLRDLRGLLTFDISNDILRFYVGTMGLKHISEEFSDMVYKRRNPYHYPAEVLLMMIRERFVEDFRPKLNLKLHKHFHPSLEKLSKSLEYCILRFHYDMKICFYRDGSNIPSKEMYIKLVAECAIRLYSIIAVLSRVSNSCYSQSETSKEELSIAELFITEKSLELEYLLDSILAGEWFCTDNNYKRVSKKCINTCRYFPEHPLKDNF